MKSHTQSHPPYGFAIGLAAGMCVGAGLAIWLSPRSASELREHITHSTKDIGQHASAKDDMRDV
jgi:gas vesicle protein